MTGSGIGNHLDPVSKLLIQYGVKRELNDEINRLIFFSLLGQMNMREVKNLASGMKDAIAKIKQLNTDAQSGLQSEMNRAAVNAEKVKAFTKELSDANKEVEDFLGDTGSNFPTSDQNTQAPIGHPVADRNGVILNTEK